MNYFAHGRHYVNRPYALAGTALPDWLNVVDRKVRVRSKRAAEFLHDPDPLVAELAAGVMQHHHDDGWFHKNLAFVELSWQFAVLLRDALPDDEGFRPSFLGHILVELLLDSHLIADQPQALHDYYAALDQLDPTALQAAVNRLAPRPVPRLAEFLPLFSRERFLWDYQEDDKLCFRLGQVLRRVGLAPLPADFIALLPEARRRVADRAHELTTPPPGDLRHEVRHESAAVDLDPGP